MIKMRCTILMLFVYGVYHRQVGYHLHCFLYARKCLFVSMCSDQNIMLYYNSCNVA